MDQIIESSTDSLNEAPPACTAEFARDFVRRNYGINGEVHQLDCERDQIFTVHTGPDEGFVLRFTNPAEDRQVSSFQTEALRHRKVCSGGD